MDFREVDEKKKDNINQNYPIFDDILEDNTFKLYYLSFKYKKTLWPAQYSTLKLPKIELLTLLIPKLSGNRSFNPPILEPLTFFSTTFLQLPISIKKIKVT